MEAWGCSPEPNFSTPHQPIIKYIVKRKANILGYTQFFYTLILAKAPFRVFHLALSKDDLIKKKEK